MKYFCETLYVSGLFFLMFLSKEINCVRRRMIRQTFNLSLSSFSLEDFQSSSITELKDEGTELGRQSAIKTRNSFGESEKGKSKILNHHPSRPQNPVIFPNSGNEKPIRLVPIWNYSIIQADEPPITFLDIQTIKPPKDPKNKPSCAVGMADTYCTKISSYPEEYINMLLARGEIKDNGLFGVDPVVKYTVAQRIDVDDELPLCESKEIIEYPKVGETEDGDWFFILNNDKLKQGVRVEKCVNPGNSCSFFQSLKTKCVQKYLHRKMVAIKDGQVTEMKFKIPSCCMCSVQNSGHLVSRRSPLWRVNRKFINVHRRDNTPAENRKSKRSPIDDSSSDSVIFPDALVSKTIPQLDLGPKGPKCANGATFCEKVTTYPKDYVKYLVKQNSLKDYALFGSDLDPPIDIVTRYDDAGITLCTARTEKIFPEVARTHDDDWKYIVQGDDEEYKQAVVLEMCQTEGGPCNFNKELPAGYESFCKQKFVFREMLSISPDDGKPTVDHFQLPSCCVCQVKSARSIASRFGVSQPPITPAKRHRRHRKS